MSVQAITCALALRGVTASEKLLLLALANYADENMRCWPSQKRLAADTCLSERTVRTLLAAMEGRKLLSREEQRRRDGSRSSDVVTLHFHGEVNQQAEVIAGGGEVTSGGVGKSFPGGGEMVSGLTTFEPSLNQSEAEASSSKVARRRCPMDFYPRDEDIDTAIRVEGFTPGEIDRELSKIKDHEFRTPRKDWDAVFRTWMKTAAERKPRHERPTPRQAKYDARQDNLASAMRGFEIQARREPG